MGSGALCAAAKDGEESPLIVPLPNVCDCTLRKVLQYCIQHTMSAKQVTGGLSPPDNLTIREMDAWDKNYIMVSALVLEPSFT